MFDFTRRIPYEGQSQIAKTFASKNAAGAYAHSIDSYQTHSIGAAGLNISSGSPRMNTFDLKWKMATRNASLMLRMNTSPPNIYTHPCSKGGHHSGG